MARFFNFKILAFFISAAMVLFSFQNCSKAVFGIENVDASGLNSENGNNDNSGNNGNTVNVICDPLNNTGTTCNNINPNDPPTTGLLGKIYYLTKVDHKKQFGGNLRNATLQDYYDFGFVVDADIYLTDINVSPRAFDVGFRLPDDSIVKDLDGNELFEWFAIKLDGFLSLPAGDYDFAILSDDGMSISLNDATIVRDDGVHAPRLACARAPVNFAADEAKKIDLEYFQGPRFKISMQLLIRAHDPAGGCALDGSWEEVPAAAFTE